MDRRPLLPFLALSLPLAGCAGGAVSSTSPAASAANLSGNWQIQTGTPATLSSVVLLTGALEVQGSAVAGTFQGDAFCGRPQTLTVTGTFDAARTLTFSAGAASGLSVQLSVPASPNAFSTGTLQASGTICNLAINAPAIGVEVAPLTATFAGPVTAQPGNPAQSPTSGTVTVALTQSSTANPDGRFPLSGTLAFAAGTCSMSVPISGTISGLGFTLASAASPFSGAQYVSLLGTSTPLATQLPVANLLFVDGPCSQSAGVVGYTGSLLRQ